MRERLGELVLLGGLAALIGAGVTILVQILVTANPVLIGAGCAVGFIGFELVDDGVRHWRGRR